ncbi:hypothetical protein [Cupriavidus oxalaticus]|uniref:hypothetical protein n=1 Tax=Cupriavidus oxalaticus TaxID=96344 RepID=UPI00317E071A
MSVPIQNTVFSYVANGSTSNFAYECYVIEAGDLAVYLDDVKQAGGYTVTGVGNVSGGDVVFSTNPIALTVVRIERDVAIKRDTQYQILGDFRSPDVNNDYDRLWMVLQRVAYFMGLNPGQFSRVLMLGPGDVNGAGAYRSMQNRIQDLANPIAGQDAVNLQTLLQKIAEFSTDGTGQAVMQLLADTTSPTNGAARIGLNLPSPGSVGPNLHTRLRSEIYREEYTSWQAAVDAAVSLGLGYLHVRSATIGFPNPVDMKGLGIIGNQTELQNTTNLRNVGPLRGCTVRGYPTDVDFIHGHATGGVHQKIMLRESSTVLAVLIKRRGKGYVKCEHWYNSFTSNPTDTGGASQNYRACVTRFLSEVYVYKHAADFETAAAWGASANVLVSQSFPTGTVTARQVKYRSTSTLNAEIAWNVDATAVGQVGYVGVYCTGGSAASVELYVNGTLQKTFSAVLVGTQYLLPVRYEATRAGSNEVKLKKVSGGTLNAIGAEFATLENYAGKRTIDSIAYGDYDRDYVEGNGASDYAFFSVNQGKWFGSVHGGETERAAPYLMVDGDVTTIPAATDTFVTGQHMRLQQTTTMTTGADSMDVDSVYTYFEDGVQAFDCSMKGSAYVSTAYTAMSATNEDFDNVTLPRAMSIAEGKNILGRHNKVTQINRTAPLLPLNLTVMFTLFPMGGPSGANMGANGPYISGQAGAYNKLYYGPVLDCPTTLTELGFSTVRFYE